MALSDTSVDQIVSLTPSYPQWVRQATAPPDTNPATCLPKIRINTLKEWEESRALESDSVSLPSDADLCQRCAIVAKHAHEIFETELYASHLYDGNREELRTERLHPCPLCTLLAQLPMFKVVKKDSDEAIFGLYAVNLLGQHERLAALDYPPHQYSMGLTVSEGNLSRPEKRLITLSRNNHRYQGQGLVLPAWKPAEHVGNRTPFVGCLIDPENIDFSVARRWVKECTKEHPGCASQHNSTGFSPPLTVLDCQTEDILLLPPEDGYLALSYVWGPPTNAKSSGNSRLFADFPRTVRDAVAVTLKLGFRYLWVDRYCINQQDEADKKAQIARMDMIYENAIVTIVAAAGKDDNHGLPGAGTLPLIPRAPQAKAQVNGYTLITLEPNIVTAVRESKWATRGWTYQESTLSMRCLVFTPYQIYFMCRTTHHCEVLPQFPMLREYRPHSEVTIESIFSEEKNSIALEEMTQLETLNRQADIYLDRTLTFDSDALNAFRGMLTRDPFWSFHGVPLITRAGRELSPKPKCEHGASQESETLAQRLSREQNMAVATDEFINQIVASQPKDFSKKRQIMDIFGGSHDEEYAYDHLPGPGEPIEPSPLLSFLHGLCWETAPKEYGARPTHKLRAYKPRWSWLSLHQGPIRFNIDPDGRKECSNDVYTNRDCGVLAWVKVDGVSGPGEWIDFDSLWAQSKNKIIPELGSLLKVESLAAPITNVIVQATAFALHPWEIKTLVKLEHNYQHIDLEIAVDCYDDLPCQGNKKQAFPGLGWKIALLHQGSIYNPGAWDLWSGWNDWIFVVLQPEQGHWKRIGLLKTKEKLDIYTTRETLILC